MQVEIAPGDLPESARQLAVVIGMPAVIALVQARGGRTVEMPRKPAGAWFDGLCADIGEDAARALIAWAPGVRLTIPNCKAAISKARQRAIAAADTGKSANEIAAAFGVHERTVRKIRQMPARELRRPEKSVVLEVQGTLF